MSKRAGRATWFPWELAWKDSLLSLEKGELADLLIMSMEYFSQNEIRPIESLGIEDKTIRFAFSLIKQSIDTALVNYKESQKYGREGAEKRKSINEGKGG